MEAYLAAKAKLLDAIASGGTAVVNADDNAWRALAALPRTVRFSSASNVADVTAAGLAAGDSNASVWVQRPGD